MKLNNPRGNDNVLRLFILIIVIMAVIFISRSIINGMNKKIIPVNNVNSIKVTNKIATLTCPTGFIKIPGNKEYNTSDFCVMKYDAKCADVSNPTIGLQPKLGDPSSGEIKGHAFGVYNNSGIGSACVLANNRQVVSTASGFPIAYIPESDGTPNNAENYCALSGWHLITNDEWMTIARNVEQVPANWCDSNGTNCGFPPGTPGKILASGHSDKHNEASAGGSSTDSAIVAGSDDEPCYGTTTDGSNACGGKSSQKRTLTISNGQIIWDFAGNVWQWVDNTVMRKNEPKSKTNGILDTIGWIRSDFAPGSLPSVLSDNGQGLGMGYNSFRPSNPNWNANNGVGRIYHYSSNDNTDTTLYTFIRGGNWKHGTDDGAFTMHMSPTPDKIGINDVGFRCVSNGI